MSEGRRKILEALREAGEHSGGFKSLSAAATGPRLPRSFAELWPVLARECARVQTTLERIRGGSGLARYVAELARKHSAQRMLVESATLPAALDVTAFERHPLPGGLSLLRADEIPTLAVRQERPVRQLVAEADLAITGGAFVVAETGTLVRTGHPGALRLAALLPPVHVAVVSAEQLIPDWESLIAALDRLPRRPTDIALITGPSRTADIEKVLVMPAHGPKEFHLLFLDPAEPA
jgi:L-lactate utilization protein LutC